MTNDAERCRIEVWVAMADHFLDTETRQDIPFTAFRCIEAGLSSAEARDIWIGEVSPAVGFNLWDVAGEWAYWDRDWLVKRIERLRSGRVRRTRWFKWLRDHACWDPARGLCTSIERCVDLFGTDSDAGYRERLFRAMAFLARHYFDFCPAELATLSAPDRERVRSLYPEPFQYVLAPALGSSEAPEADRRVRAALSKEIP